jgi:predicted aminopeptidase
LARPRSLLVLFAMLLSGCGQPLYVARLGWTEAKILWRREPIREVIAEPGTDAGLRERLTLVLAAREFARERLGLQVGGSYGSYAVIAPEEATIHVVSAAYRDHLTSYTWWYPVAGRVPYRGFFDERAAQAEAARLARRDLDVDVRPAVAFSSLGWFADPLLSTMAQAEAVPLVTTVLHELFHQTLYVPGEPAFNESAATFAGGRGAVAFFCARDGTDAPRCREAQLAWEATRARGRVLGRLADKLRRLYATHPAPTRRERARARLAAAAARTLERRGLGGEDDVLPPNNARLLGMLLYATRLDDFEALAPGAADPGPALRTLVAAARGERDPFRVLAGLGTRSETSSRVGTGGEHATFGGSGERRAAAGKAGAADRGKLQRG